MKSLPLAQLILNRLDQGQPLGSRPSVRIASAAIAMAVAVVSAAPVIAEQSSGTYVGDISSDGEIMTDGEVSDGEIVDGGIVNEGSFVGDCRSRAYGQPDLFYNYYTQGFCNRANAQMYVSPLPVPPNVGHTFYTYQPFYPHHMLYWHKDRYHRYYDNGRGMNRTRATYYSPPIKQAASNLYWNFLRIPR